MIVNSFNPEFGYELLSSLPYSYYLHLHNKLEGTVSGYDTAPLYFFSKNHVENKTKRSFFNNKQATEAGIPNTFIHNPEYNTAQIAFPDYRKQYLNKEFKYKKPTLCICNRYNDEWSLAPINYFDLPMLRWLFDNLSEKYEIIYFEVDLPDEYQDNAKSKKLGDVKMIKSEYSKIKIFGELVKKHGYSRNETLLKIFANCEHYLTMNGGYSIMASYFKGTNIIYSRYNKEAQTRELSCGSFWRWYSNIANNRTLHVSTYEQLKDKIKALYIDCLPTINILIRTCKRPIFFNSCIKSIEEQTYKNYNIIAITEEDEAVQYTRKYKIRQVDVRKKIHYPIMPKPLSQDYGMGFKYNRYLDYAQNLVNDGWIMFLDDDDIFNDKYALEKISKNLNEENNFVVWKSDINGKIMPLKHEIKLYDISGICFAYHKKNIKYSDWSEWKRADYRTAKKMSENLNVVWIDEVLTATQSKAGMGQRKDKYSEMLRIEISDYCDEKRIIIINKNEFENYQTICNRIGHKLKIL